MWKQTIGGGSGKGEGGVFDQDPEDPTHEKKYPVLVKIRIKIDQTHEYYALSVYLNVRRRRKDAHI